LVFRTGRDKAIVIRILNGVAVVIGTFDAGEVQHCFLIMAVSVE
jgi:hypothetical protein